MKSRGHKEMEDPSQLIAGQNIAKMIKPTNRTCEPRNPQAQTDSPDDSIEGVQVHKEDHGPKRSRMRDPQVEFLGLPVLLALR